MSPKEYLGQIRKLNILIEQKRKERDELREGLTGLTGIDYSKDRVQVSSAPGATFERTVDKIDAMEREIDRLVDEYIETRWQIISEIQALPDPIHVQVLYKRYAEFKTLARIAGEMHYSYEWTRHIHGDALKAFGEKTTH